MTIEEYAGILVSTIAETKAASHRYIEALKLHNKIEELSGLYDKYKLEKPKLARLCQIDMMHYMSELQKIEEYVVSSDR